MNYKIKLNQLDTTELSGYFTQMSRSGQTTGSFFPIPSGVSSISVSWSSKPHYAIPTIQTSGLSDPMILCGLQVFASTGCSILLSDQTRSSNYYLHLARD